MIPPAYVAWQAGTTNGVFVPARQAGNRVQGSLKGLQIWALEAVDNVSKEVLNERFLLVKNWIGEKNPNIIQVT